MSFKPALLRAPFRGPPNLRRFVDEYLGNQEVGRRILLRSFTREQAEVILRDTRDPVADTSYFWDQFFAHENILARIAPFFAPLLQRTPPATIARLILRGHADLAAAVPDALGVNVAQASKFTSTADKVL